MWVHTNKKQYTCVKTCREKVLKRASPNTAQTIALLAPDIPEERATPNLKATHFRCQKWGTHSCQVVMYTMSVRPRSCRAHLTTGMQRLALDALSHAPEGSRASTFKHACKPTAGLAAPHQSPGMGRPYRAPNGPCHPHATHMPCHACFPLPQSTRAHTGQPASPLATRVLPPTIHIRTVMRPWYTSLSNFMMQTSRLGVQPSVGPLQESLQEARCTCAGRQPGQSAPTACPAMCSAKSTRAVNRRV